MMVHARAVWWEDFSVLLREHVKMLVIVQGQFDGWVLMLLCSECLFNVLQASCKEPVTIAVGEGLEAVGGNEGKAD